MRNAARVASTALITAGLVILLDVGITLAWGEPVSALRGWVAQQKAQEELERLEERSYARRQRSLDPQKLSARADRFAKRIEVGDAIGRVLIPAIDLNIVQVEGTDTGTLRKGPGHYPETILPGQRGTVGIAGHRTTYLAPFRHIDEIGRGDEAVVEMPYATFTYRFEKQRIVDPSQVGVVRDVDQDRVVLTACHPLYSAAQRIVVFARLVDVEPPGGDGASGKKELGESAASGLKASFAGAGGLVLITAMMWLVSGRGEGPRHRGGYQRRRLRDRVLPALLGSHDSLRPPEAPHPRRGKQTVSERLRLGRPFARAIWIGIAVQLAGRIVDGRWHATHDEFEGAAQQLEAHWLVWIGVLVTLIAAGSAMRRLAAEERNAGYPLVFWGAVLYVGVAAWHFLEHVAHNDPALPHILLVVTTVMMIAGALLVLLLPKGGHGTGGRP